MRAHTKYPRVFFPLRHGQYMQSRFVLSACGVFVCVAVSGGGDRASQAPPALPLRSEVLANPVPPTPPVVRLVVRLHEHRRTGQHPLGCRVGALERRQEHVRGPAERRDVHLHTIDRSAHE